MRTGRLCALVLAVVFLVPAVARADGPASVHVARCKTGPEPSERTAAYKAWMDAVPGSVRMALRFRLVAHYPGHRPEPIADSKLRVWHRSHEGVWKALGTHLGRATAGRPVLTLALAETSL